MALPYGLQAGMSATTKVNEDIYEARCLTHAIVYRLNRKAVKSELVPQQVKEQLIGTMLIGVRSEVDEDIPVEVTGEDLALVTALAQPNPSATSLEDATTLDVPSDDFGFTEADAPVIDMAQELKELEAKSVDNVSLKVLIQTLYQRFGIYTVYLNQAPKNEDISPLTGTMMNTFILGQAYQHFKAAQRDGSSWNGTIIKQNIEAARGHRDTPSVMPITDMERNQTITNEPYAPRVNRHFESPHKSAVHSERGNERDGLDPDEVYAEPPINAKTAIIREFYPNQQSQAQLEQISRTRKPAESMVSFDDII